MAMRKSAEAPAARAADDARLENNFIVDGQDVSVVTKSGDDSTTINLRENFNALALFSPTVKTDSNGKATVDIKLPDNLTRYRITAVSVDTAGCSALWQPRARTRMTVMRLIAGQKCRK